jgi:hypothetical protein
VLPHGVRRPRAETELWLEARGPPRPPPPPCGLLNQSGLERPFRQRGLRLGECPAKDQFLNIFRVGTFIDPFNSANSSVENCLWPDTLIRDIDRQLSESLLNQRRVEKIIHLSNPLLIVSGMTTQHTPPSSTGFFFFPSGQGFASRTWANCCDTYWCGSGVQAPPHGDREAGVRSQFLEPNFLHLPPRDSGVSLSRKIPDLEVRGTFWSLWLVKP